MLRRIRDDFLAMLPWSLRRLSTVHRKALAVTLISLVGWSLWNGLREFDHPWGDLSRGKFTDHFSHMNAARAFLVVGRDIWRKPIAAQFRLLTPEERQEIPPDIRGGASSTGGVFHVPGWPKDKPLAVSWSDKPRMYPPGDMLLVAPIALLYHYTSLSLAGACRMLLGWFVILAHVALFLLFLSYFEGKGTSIDWVICFFVYSLVMYWTLEGFYDAVAIVPLILCARYLGQRRGLAAAVAFCVGAFLHFRVFFQAPWVVIAAGLMMRDKLWRKVQPRDFLALAVASVCGGLALYVFWLDWDSLSKLALNNPLRNAVGVHNKGLIWNFEVLAAVCGAAFLLSKDWFDVVSLAWLVLMTFSLREFYVWHLLISPSWLVAPARHGIAKGVRFAFLFSAIAILFNEEFAPNWLWMLYHPGSN